MNIPVCEIGTYLLPSTEIILKDGGIDENFDECICYECSKQPIVSLQCGHIYHKECISKWIEKCEAVGPTCPQCRHSMIKGDYKFWFKLGRETCNMRKWGDYCQSIIYANFGSSSKYSKVFPSLLGVQANLDSLLQQSYDYSEDSEFNEHLKKYLQVTGNVSCTQVFYCIGTIIKPDTPHRIGKYPKTITQHQKDYIDEFRKRCNKFLGYLNFIAENIPKPKHTDRWQWNSGRKMNSLDEFKGTVKKLKKCYDKLILLDEINLS